MAKIRMPDGKGGYVTVEATEHAGQTIGDPQRQQKAYAEAYAKAFWERVDTASKRFNELEKVVATEAHLTEEEFLAAKYLDLLNWQRFFPKELGGQDQFATICETVQTWFTEQLKQLKQ